MPRVKYIVEQILNENCIFKNICILHKCKFGESGVNSLAHKEQTTLFSFNHGNNTDE